MVASKQVGTMREYKFLYTAEYNIKVAVKHPESKADPMWEDALESAAKREAFREIFKLVNEDDLTELIYKDEPIYEEEDCEL